MKQKKKSLDRLLKGRAAVIWTPSQLKQYEKKQVKIDKKGTSNHE